MQSKASNETIWKRLYEDAVLELQPTLFGEKAKAAEKAILDRLQQVDSGNDSNRRELMELSDAYRTITLLQREELKDAEIPSEQRFSQLALPAINPSKRGIVG